MADFCISQIVICTLNSIILTSYTTYLFLKIVFFAEPTWRLQITIRHHILDQVNMYCVDASKIKNFYIRKALIFPNIYQSDT
jgi:hypothetical protein